MRPIQKFIASVLLMWGILQTSIYAATDRWSALEDVRQWAVWKTAQPVDDAQRSVLNYLTQALSFDEGLEVYWSTSGKSVSLDLLKKKFSALNVPETCQKYHAVLRHLVELIGLAQSRAAAGNPPFSEQEKAELFRTDAEGFSEFFTLLSSAGLFDRYEAELKSLKSGRK
jgi:hypothetical protein